MQVYKIIFEEVQKIINDYDPMGLVSGGAPDDEYHTEIGKIVALLRTEVEANSLAKKVENLFNESFDEISADKNLYLIMSQKLLDLKKRLKW